MRFATVEHDAVVKSVVFREEGLVDLGELARKLHPAFSPYAFPVGTDLIETWVTGNPMVRKVAAAAMGDPTGLPLVPASEARFLPPIPDTRQVIAVGLNYASHCQEQGRPAPERPLYFAKLVSCLTGHIRPVVHWPLTAELDYEGELAVIIGRGGRAIPPDEALSHVFGYTVANDVTARDLQRNDRQWTRAKGMDTFGPLGPCVATADEVPDPRALRIRTWVNGDLRQDAPTSEMAFPVASLIADISTAIELRPGDVLLTGTPAGVGVFAKPVRFLNAGDRVRIEIEGIGVLENEVVAPTS